MSVSPKHLATDSPIVGQDSSWDEPGNRSEQKGPNGKKAQGPFARLMTDSEFGSVVATFLTTLSIFGIFLIQGFVIARILGPTGRGEFGTAMFFPRDVFLYAGLLGGIEIVNSYAVRASMDLRSLKFSAAKLGFVSGIITAVIAAVISVSVMLVVGKSYLIPFCLICCVFLPWEHMQLTISAVDRGSKNFRFYNVNRLIYAASFLCLVAIVFGLNIEAMLGLSSLTMMCILFVLSKIVGIFPTLRGMDVIGTLFGKSPSVKDAAALEMEKAEVPSVWSLLVQGRFYALSMLASEMFERLDVFLVVAIASVTDSGYYFVAVPAAQLLTVAPNALGVFTFNAGADEKKQVSLRKVVTVMVATIGLQVVSAFVLAVLIPILIITFFKEPYAPAIPFALWLLPAYGIKGFLQAADGYLKGLGKPMVGVWARFLSIFVMLAFVGMVYGGVINWFENKLFCIPVAALIGQAISMLIISVAVIRDASSKHSNSELEDNQ